MSASLRGRDLLSLADLSAPELASILDLAAAAKGGRQLGRPLEGSAIALIFQWPSNRTRVSFEVAVQRLGTKSITYAFEFFKDGEAVARGQITCVCCVVGAGQPMRGREIPASFRVLLERPPE